MLSLLFWDLQPFSRSIKFWKVLERSSFLDLSVSSGFDGILRRKPIDLVVRNLQLSQCGEEENHLIGMLCRCRWNLRAFSISHFSFWPWWCWEAKLGTRLVEWCLHQAICGPLLLLQVLCPQTFSKVFAFMVLYLVLCSTSVVWICNQHHQDLSLTKRTRLWSLLRTVLCFFHKGEFWCPGTHSDPNCSHLAALSLSILWYCTCFARCLLVLWRWWLFN